MEIADTTLALMPEADLEGVTRASTDYLQAWYTGDAERMRRCLHPDLAKRTVARDPQTGNWILRHTDKRRLVALTREGSGSNLPQAERTQQLVVLDSFRHLASVKLVSHEFIDYLHLAKLAERWLIVNVLWELKEGVIDTEPRRLEMEDE